MPRRPRAPRLSARVQRARRPNPSASRAVRDASAGVALALGASVATGLTLGATIAVVVARAVVTPPHRRRDPVRLRAVDAEAGTVTLARTTESAATGTYTLVYAAGVGRCSIGEIVSLSDRWVTRRFWGETGAPIAGHRFVRLASAPERTLDDVGVPWREVRIPTELGPSPAWVFEADTDASGARSRDWAIHVHGRGAVLTEPLRSVRVLHEAGWNSLVVSYRNDAGAPASPDGRFGLGATEWRDVDAAMAWALAHGARRLILVGWSMGGATVMQALLESRRAAAIAGIVLESPVVSWRATLERQGRTMRLPWWVIRLALALLRSPASRVLVGTSAPIPLERMELLDRAQEIRVPILLIHSTGDTVVPHQPSAALARRLPALVRYEQFDRALHVRNWNVDAERWERALRQWLATLDSTDAGEASGSLGSATSRE